MIWLKVLKFEELSIKQKLGMTLTAVLNTCATNREAVDYVLELVKEHCIGSVWLQQGYANVPEVIKEIKEVADYPIIIMTDAESGIGEYLIGRHNAIGCTGSTKHAYAFGKVLGVAARKMGYNMVCDPVVDMIPGGQRSLGTDKHKVSELAVAIGKGMHDGGVLTVAKHYPGGKPLEAVDTHMAEAQSAVTKEELLDYALYPYLKMLEEDVLDGIMTRHCRFLNIDDKHPASLSKPVIDIIREQGFDGISITDGLCMMGIKANYDDVTAKGLAIAAGNDLALPYVRDNKLMFEQHIEAYEKGLIPDEMLDAAVKRIIKTQEKILKLEQNSEMTEDDLKTFRSINKDGIYTHTAEGVSHAIDKDGKYFFAVMVKNGTKIDGDGRAEVDTFSNPWFNPEDVAKKIKATFKNSVVEFIDQFPSQGNIVSILEHSLGYETIFVTFTEPIAYTGPECLTRRFVNVIKAMQGTDRISTVVHFGNPFVLEELPHIDCYILGGNSAVSVETAIEVLAGEYPANGVPTYNADLK